MVTDEFEFAVGNNLLKPAAHVEKKMYMVVLTYCLEKSLRLWIN